MLYAYQDGRRTIVGAASTAVELETLHASAEACDLKTEVIRPAPFDMMVDEYLSRFKVPPVIVEHDSPEQQAAFADKFGLTLTKKNALVDRHDEMLYEIKEEKMQEELPDGMTIGQYYGLDKDDPWDKRSDEEKAQDEHFKKMYEEAKKAGKLSGDSFAAPKGDQVKVTDIHSHTDQDGNVVIDDVLAVKGLHDSNDEDRIAAEAARAKGEEQEGKGYGQTISLDDLMGEAGQAVTKSTKGNPFFAPPQAEQEVEVEDDFSIDPNGMIAIYHKVDVTGAKLLDTLPVLENAQIDVESLATAFRDVSTGCWYAFARLTHAEKVAETLTTFGFTAEVYGVNDKGERLVAKGATVVDTEAEHIDPPRPWNDRAKELAGMTDEEREKTMKDLSGKEFIFCGAYNGPEIGAVVYIVPKSYFSEHREMYPEPLNIGHLLPQDLKEVSPGIYQTRGRSDFNMLSYELCKRGMVESVFLQLHLNNL